MEVLFGKPKKSKKPTSSVDNLQECIKKLTIRELQIQNDISELETTIRNALKNKQKSVAVIAVKKKQMYEKYLMGLNSQKTNLELTIVNMKGLELNVEIKDALSDSANVMKDFHKKLSVDDVNDTMSELTENVEKSADLTTMLSTQIDFGVIDDQSIEQELQGYLDEIDEENMSKLDELPHIRALTPEKTSVKQKSPKPTQQKVKKTRVLSLEDEMMFNM